MPSLPTSREKAALRERMRELRSAVERVERTRAERDVTERMLRILGGPRVVLCYVSVRSELPTRTLLEALRDAGHTVAVPEVVGGEIRARLLGRLVPGAYGIPTGDGAPVEIVEFALVPGLAFDPYGGRLGQGGGYYDRFLAAHGSVVAIGLAYDFQLVERVPRDRHDACVHHVVTPQRHLRVAAC